MTKSEMNKKILGLWVFPFGLYDLVKCLNFHWSVAFLLLLWTVRLGVAQQAQPPIGLKITKIKTASGQKYKVGGRPSKIRPESTLTEIISSLSMYRKLF